MSRFLIDTYDLLSEIALWLMFVSAVVGGYYAGGLGGVLIALIITFIIAVFAVTPFMMLSDLRKATVRIEKIAMASYNSNPNRSKSSSKMAPSRRG